MARGRATGPVSRLMLAAVVGAALSAAGCSGTPPAEPQLSSPTFRIAVLVPMTGPDAQSGRGAVAAINTVIDERRQELASANIQIELTVLDDRGQQSVAQQQVTTVIDDELTVALIGSVNSIVDEGFQPIAADAGLPSISLGGVDPTLTSRSGQRPFDNYQTLAARTTDRAALAADLAVDSGKTVVVIRGDRAVDREMTTAFVSRARDAGAAVTVVESLVVTQAGADSDAARTRAAWVRDLGALKPSAVYVVTDEESIWPNTEAIRQAASSATVLLDEPAVGRWPAELAEAETVDAARGVAWGPTLATTTGANANTIAVPATPTPTPTDRPAQPEVDELILDGRYAVAGTDAARAVVDAVLAVAGDSSGSTASPKPIEALREAVADHLGSHPITSVLGPVRFDPSGVATHRGLGVFVRAPGRWTPRESWSVSGDCSDRDDCSLVRVIKDRS